MIKSTATGGVNSNIAGGLGQQMFDDEMKAIVDTAHLFGRKVAAHAHGADGIKAALKRASTRSSTRPTPTPRPMRCSSARAPGWCRRWWRRTRPWPRPCGRPHKATLAKAEEVVAAHENIASRRDGVRIAFGTDSGVSDHGKNAQEFDLLVKAGMKPAAAIRAATVRCGQLLDALSGSAPSNPEKTPISSPW